MTGPVLPLPRSEGAPQLIRDLFIISMALFKLCLNSQSRLWDSFKLGEIWLSGLLDLISWLVPIAPPELDRSSGYSPTYDSTMVTLSIAIGVLGSYAAFALAEQTRASLTRNEWLSWLAGGGIVLGGAIWTLHFVGMLAWHVPIPIQYDFLTTLLSALPAIAAGSIMLAVISVKNPSTSAIVGGGVLMGLGIGTMHYAGMNAIIVETLIYYDPFYFLASVGAAVSLSILALFVKSAVVNAEGAPYRVVRIFGASVLMGAAIAVTHYTGMAAAICISPQGVALGESNTVFLAVAVSLASTVLLLFAILAGQLGKRLRSIPRLKQEIERRRVAERALEASREALAVSHFELENRVEQRTRELLLEVKERELAEQKLLEALREVQQANEMKSRFLSHVSHELRTPLNGIIGYLEYLSSGAYRTMEVEKVEEIFSDILGASNHLLSLIEDVLDLARIEAGKQEVHPEELRVEDAVQASVSLVAPDLENKCISLRVKHDDPDAVVKCDAKHLRQILINVTANAIKYTSPNSVIEVYSKNSGVDGIEISVTDNGQGIPASELPLVFKEFERSEGAMVSTNEGAGLGLPLSLRLTEINGGTLILESEEGKGTKVTVILPSAGAESSAANLPAFKAVSAVLPIQ